MEQKSYGISYQGSKNLIARKIVAMMTPPPKERKNTIFADIFFGGGAITHCAIEQNIASYYVGNDINRDMIDLFGNALTGKYRNENRWISREEFEKSKDPYVKVCWSFNNNRTGYLYAYEIEPLKKALYYIFVYGDTKPFCKFYPALPTIQGSYEERIQFYRTYIKQHHEKIKERYIKWYFNTILHEEIEEIKPLVEKTTERMKDLEDYMVSTFKQSGLKLSDINKHLNNQMASHYFTHTQWAIPTAENYKKLKEIMPQLNIDKTYLSEYRNAINTLQSLESLESLQSLQSLERLERLERLQSLQSLERLERLEDGWVCTEDIYYWHKIYKKGNITLNLTTGEYYDMFYYVTGIARDIDEKLTRQHPNSTEDFYPHIIFYCDPPYINTAGYGKEDCAKTTFDHERFYKWCELYTMTEQNIEIFISEKYMPEDRFVCILEMQKINNFAQGGQVVSDHRLHAMQVGGTDSQATTKRPTNAYTEKLFVPKRQWERHKAKYIQRALKIVAEEEKTNISNTILQTENISQQGMYNLF